MVKVIVSNGVLCNIHRTKWPLSPRNVMAIPAAINTNAPITHRDPPGTHAPFNLRAATPFAEHSFKSIHIHNLWNPAALYSQDGRDDTQQNHGSHPSQYRGSSCASFSFLELILLIRKKVKKKMNIKADTQILPCAQWCPSVRQ